MYGVHDTSYIMRLLAGFYGPLEDPRRMNLA
jgi:hypothetical protein